MVKSLSVFFPAYNEQENIVKTVTDAVIFLKTLNLDEWEVLIIDDGSTDKTPELADKLADDDKHIKVIHQPNGGYGMALRAGFYNAKYDWVLVTDSDGQFDFSESKRLLDLTDKADAVWGYRIKRQDPFFRVMNAKGWAIVVFLTFGLDLKDIDCAFKLVKKSVIDEIPPLKSTRGAMISAELAIKINQAGHKIAQVGVNHYSRDGGQPTGASIAVIIQSFVDLFKLRFKL